MAILKPQVFDKAGSAWRGVVTPEHRAAWPAGLDVWLVHVPKAHPFWSWYIVTGCSLRDLETVAPARKQSPEMDHEINIVALHPDFFIDEQWLSRWAAFALTPLNFSEQVVGLEDEEVNRLIIDFVFGFCSGVLNPDSDFRSINRNYMNGTIRTILRAS